MAEGLVEAAETVEEVVEAVREFNGVHPYVVVGLVSGSVAAGIAVGYYVCKNRLEKKFDEILKDELDILREHYKSKTEATMGRITKPDLDAAVQTLGYRTGDGRIHHPNDVVTIKEVRPYAQEEAPVEVISEVEGEGDDEEVVPLAPRSKNVFDRSNVAVAPEQTDVWDYAAEVKSRNPREPYIIHVDEFTQNEKGYTQSTLTYYEDDDVLADERDNVIEDQDEMVGVHNLVRFGHGSNDANTVHIRNDKRQLDLEILRSTGSYAEEVHGFKHMDEPNRRRRGWVE